MSLPGSRRPSTVSRSREFYGRRGSASLFKSATAPATPTEKQPLLPASRRPSPPVSMRDTCGTSSLSSSSNSGSCKGSDSSPTPRRPVKYLLCSDNHGIKPPTPEQYLTPLQQKEVCIRHLRARLRDTHERLQDRLASRVEKWKAVEKVAAQQLQQAPDEADCLDPFQSGFRPGRGTERASEQAIQTDFGHYQPDLDTILEKVMKSQAGSLGSPTSGWPPEVEEVAEPSGSETCVLSCSDPTDRTATEPFSAAAIHAGEPAEMPDGQPVSTNPAVHQPSSASPSVSIVCSPEEEAAEPDQEAAGLAASSAEPKTYWSRHFIVDLLAVVVPAVPTVAWLCRSQRRQGQPIYNISSLLRGCCTVALHSIRKISCRSVTNVSSTCSQP
ncbi:syntaphilin [Candoia aspera]|uniref:syntaphilin n=1 Tax=Candoia aspera TaxID=51853 RepID=UPI002FD8578B